MLRALDGACDDTGEKADKERIKEKVLLRTLPAAVHVDDIAQRGKGEITDAHRRENIQAGGRIMQAEGIQQRSQRFAQKVEVFIIEQTAHAQRQRHDQTDAAHPFDAQTFQQQRRRPQAQIANQGVAALHPVAPGAPEGLGQHRDNGHPRKDGADLGGVKVQHVFEINSEIALVHGIGDVIGHEKQGELGGIPDLFFQGDARSSLVEVFIKISIAILN